MQLYSRTSAFLCLLFSFALNSFSQVTTLPGEVAPDRSQVYSGNSNDGDETYVVYIPEKGMLSVCFKAVRGTERYDRTRLALKFGGNDWIDIFDLVSEPSTTGHGINNLYTSVAPGNYYDGINSKYYDFTSPQIYSQVLANQDVPGFSVSDYLHHFLYSYNELEVYDYSYLPITNKSADLSQQQHISTFSIQTERYDVAYTVPLNSGAGSLTIPETNSAASTGNFFFSQLNGVFVDHGIIQGNNERDVNIHFNITNLPPEMISGAGFRVHLYQRSVSGNDDYIYEYDFNSQNFMTSGPSSLTTDNSSCAGTVLNWVKGNNTAPNGATLDMRTVIFRDNQYHDIVDINTTTYIDSSALINVDYDYKVMHIAFPEHGDTYFKSPETSNVQGSRKPSPEEPLVPTAESDICDDFVTIEWAYSGTDPANFRVDVATSAGGPYTMLSNTIPGFSRSYIHNNVPAGQQHFYRIYAVNSCGDLSLNYASVSQAAAPDFSTTFDTPTNQLTCSKGYFVDRVELSWANANNAILDAINIKRRVLGSASAPVQIANVTPGSQFYIDYTADAGVFYEYLLVGERYCSNGPSILTDTTIDVGFRSATGIVNGHVQYAGGIAVDSVKVTVEPSGGSSGYSFEASPGNLGTVPHSSDFDFTNEFTLEAYVKINPSPSQMRIVRKIGSFELSYLPTDDVSFSVTTGSSVSLTYNQVLTDGNYHHIAASYDGSQMKLYIDGNLVGTQVLTGNVQTNMNALRLGDVFGNTMLLDELRIYDLVKSDGEILRDYSRVLEGNNNGLVAYFRFNEGAGDRFYDASHSNGVYNENHGEFIGTPSFSTDIPLTNQLSFAGFTDANGDYTVPVFYNGVGEIFTATPSYLTHQFSPGSSSMYIGDNSQVQNGVDFEDISSFSVSGNVKYKDGTCPEEGVFLLVDGSNIIQNGQPVKTDGNGNFTIQVPIGHHFVSVERNQHVFSDGRWPVTGTFDFQAPISGIQFIDSTYVKVIGRVVGGTREASKPMIPGRSTNNIGVATIIFETLDGCHADTVSTDPISGDYEILLHPMKYQIPDFANPAVNGGPNFSTFSDPVFSNNMLLDISSIPIEQQIIDTLFTDPNHTTWSSIDSVTYQTIRSWTYRSAPSVWVTDTNWTAYDHSTAGDGELYYTNENTGVTDTVPLPTQDALGFPVFHERKEYHVNVGVIEVYTDGNTGLVDSVPVTSGNLLINNALASDPIVNLSLSDPQVYTSWLKDTSYYRYSFIGGNPNIAFTSGDPLNFSHVFGIQYSGGPNVAQWQPNGQDFNGIILGGKSSNGQSFVTLGPQVPTMIIRDPPGSKSFSELLAGQTFKNTTNWSLQTDLGNRVTSNLNLGTKFSVGLGMSVETEVNANVGVGLEVETAINEDGSLSETVELLQSWSSNNTPEFVGAGSDVFMGKSMNITFGTSQNIMLLRNSQCVVTGVECRGEMISVNGFDYRIGRLSSLSTAPGGYGTAFIYTQDHIINELIPNLITLRNQLFSDTTKYKSFLSPTDPNYGKNNDDPVFGAQATSSDPIKSEMADTIGLSYHFKVPTTPLTIAVESTLDGTITNETFPALAGDSVRWYNQQIRLWEEALALNEQDKYEALNDPNSLIQNYSFSSGVTYLNSASTSKTEITSQNFEVGISASLVSSIGAMVGGSGFSVERGLTIGYSETSGSSAQSSNTTTFDFTFLDQEQGDFYSVDVRESKRGFGPIFNVVAGETSCPWEGEEISQYYTNQSGQPVTLSNATLHRELAELKVDGSPVYSEKLNVPANNNATFNLELINLSESNDDISYGIKVLSNTNPDGAVLSIDGYDPATQSYLVAANSSLHKTLVLQRGSIAYDYDSIAVVIHSLCDDPVVGDTVYVTAHFLPTCTEVDIQYPLNQWVVNNSFNDTLPIVIGDYDINFSDLEKLGLEVKPSSQSTWIGMENWYKYVPPGNDSLEISQSSPVTNYNWDLLGVPDGYWDIRVNSTCSLATNVSPVYSGIIDRVNPHAFGTPSPGDGILDPNDDIFIQFNETVDAGVLSVYNFDVRGVLNSTDVRHSESLNFDGVDDYASVSGGANLKERSFTIEFWAKLNGTGINQTMISQGSSSLQSLSIGVNASDQLLVEIGGQQATTNSSLTTPGNWHHYAITYDFTNAELRIYVDGTLENNGNTALFFDYRGEGPLAFGKRIPNNDQFFNGNLHEVRLWNDVRTNSEIVQKLAEQLLGNEPGLLYNWRMDEAEGNFASDFVRARNADLFGPTWEVNPNGSAVSFDGTNDFITADASTNVITEEMDFTLEFWFRSNQSTPATLFSNGNGDGLQADSLTSWNIAKDASGQIHVYHNGLDFIATTQNYFDGNWHHFALVMNRSANLSAYIDGNLQQSVQATPFYQLGAPEMYLGAHGYYTGTTFNTDDFFDGEMDEFRFWNTARKLEQIERDKRNRLLGDELGLQLFIPFESYELILGVPVLTDTITDESVNTATVINNGATLSPNTPTLRLPRPIQAVPFTYSVNNDKIVISPSISPELIEKVTLDITVENVKDLNGNQMQSPETWIAYINKNQVVWQDDMLDFEKMEDSVITFQASIANTGGSQENFTIGGLPQWLSPSISSGSIAPNSTLPITFTIGNGYAVGEYFADVTLTTNFGYAEVLSIELDVVGDAPNWTVNPANFNYTMSVIGELEIDNVILSNPNSMIAAFINDTICGVANLQYLSSVDQHEVFLSIYSNSITGDSVEFKIYDASTGYTHVDVSPNLMFTNNNTFGNILTPITFSASSQITIGIPLNQGWTWVSLPLSTPDLSSSSALTADLQNSQGDLHKSQTLFDTYDLVNGWVGSLSGAGYANNESFQFRRGLTDTLHIVGERIHPDSSQATIQLNAGWNWVGYVSTKVSDLNIALGNFTPSAGDLIKSQYQFAVYDPLSGWIGSLNQMEPGLGYKMQVANAGSFNYPLSLYYGKLDYLDNLPPVLEGLDFQPELYSKTMSMIISSNICEDVIDSDGLAIVARGEDGSVRGFTRPQKVNNEYLYFLTAYSDHYEESLSFSFINLTDHNTIHSAEQAEFFNDAIEGSPNNPRSIRVADSLACMSLDLVDTDSEFTLYPNPIDEQFSIAFDHDVTVLVQIFDVSGRLIYTQNVYESSQITIIMDEEIATGVYTLNLSGDINATQKIIKN